MQIISNSIKIYCMDTVQRARYIDFLCKNGCKIVGAGMLIDGEFGYVYFSRFNHISTFIRKVESKNNLSFLEESCMKKCNTHRLYVVYVKNK